MSDRTCAPNRSWRACEEKARRNMNKNSSSMELPNISRFLANDKRMIIAFRSLTECAHFFPRDITKTTFQLGMSRRAMERKSRKAKSEASSKLPCIINRPRSHVYWFFACAGHTKSASAWCSSFNLHHSDTFLFMRKATIRRRRNWQRRAVPRQRQKWSDRKKAAQLICIKIAASRGHERSCWMLRWWWAARMWFVM